ncbi:MAG: FG-GAP-like repeat-containing protein [Candidatus Bathyarchaeota archaeon]|nr:FG-GAP-like repeat-containing protein [Candidatus Bathyarchaeota archaeon]
MPRPSTLRFFFVLFSIFLVLTLTAVSYVDAHESGLVMEAEQHWETYGVGGTCISGQHNLFVADVDGDGTEEMVTGGWAYDVSANGTRISGYAPLKVWSWNGQNITLEHTEKWSGNLGVVYAADIDGDGTTEIITAGNVVDENGSYSAALRFWSWDGQTMLLKGSYNGVSASSVCVADVDGDGEQEVVTVGKPYNATAQLSTWRWNGGNLILEANVDCCDSKNGSANSVAVCDLNSDGAAEIVTAGYANSLSNSTGQVRVWKIAEGNLRLEVAAEWRLVDGYALNSAGNVQGNTVVNNVKTADVDGDGVVEIVTGGFTYDGTDVLAQLRVWNWSGNALNLETSHEWSTSDITELKTVSINDVDDDGKTEIVTSGGAVAYGSFAVNSTEKETAQLRVWGWNGEELTQKESRNWVIGEGVMAWNVATGDLNGDGANEIVTVGCMFVGTLCDPDLRIWSILQSEAFPYLPLIAVCVAVATVVVALATLILARKRRQRTSVKDKVE